MDVPYVAHGASAGTQTERQGPYGVMNGRRCQVEQIPLDGLCAAEPSELEAIQAKPRWYGESLPPVMLGPVLRFPTMKIIFYEPCQCFHGQTRFGDLPRTMNVPGTPLLHRFWVKHD